MALATETDPQTADRARLLGCAVDRLDMSQTLARIDEHIRTRTFAQHVAINAAKVVSMRDDPELREVVEECEIVSADGQSIVWASRLLGDPLPGRVAGIDLMEQLLALGERRGLKVFILGAKPDVLEQAVEAIRHRHPHLDIVGWRDGYFPDEEGDEVAREVAASGADMLFVAMSSPKKEYWLGRHGRSIGVPFVMGVGGSVDVIAGITRRAPRIMQRLGLEWMYRLLQEPSRLWRRYLVTNTRFIYLVARELVRRRSSRRRRGKLLSA